MVEWEMKGGDGIRIVFPGGVLYDEDWGLGGRKAL